MRRALPSALALAFGLSLAAPAFAAGKPAGNEAAKEAARVEKAAPKDTAPAPVAAAPAPAAPEPTERAIEKKDGLYQARLVIRPGNLKPRRPADISVDLQKILEIPDPVTGDRAPMGSGSPYAIVKVPAPPAPEPVKGRKAVEPVAPTPVQYSLWPVGSAGNFGFHFTPETDGVYEVTVVGFDAKPTEDAEAGRNFELTFKVGVGTAAAQTEVSQGAAAGRRGGRRPVGGGGASLGDDRLQKTMSDLGYRYLDLEALLQKWPAKGPHADAAAEARAIGALFTQIKGLAPAGTNAASGEFDKLAGEAGLLFEQLAGAAGTDGKEKDRAPHLAAASAGYEKLEMQGCNQCHAKFRWGVTTDLSGWPKFEQKPWKK